jgi:NADPH:quinone reductase-like Zn-dependent oxidoreductase
VIFDNLYADKKAVPMIVVLSFVRVEEVEVPPPGKGEVQIRIKALGLNRADAMFRRANTR